MNPRRPTFIATIAALTVSHPEYGQLHTGEEDDVAELLSHVEAEHQGADEPDEPGSDMWGRCGKCGMPWPCSTWVETEQLGLLYLGRAQDRVWARFENEREARTGRERCPAVHPVDGWLCARPTGHDGVHSGTVGDPWQPNRL